MKRLTAIAQFLPLLLVWTGCEDEPIIDEALLEITWIADSLHSPDLSMMPFQDTLMVIVRGGDSTFILPSSRRGTTIIFRPDLTAAGKMLCNDYGATYTIPQIGQVDIVIGDMTEQSCWPHPEHAFEEFFTGVTNYEVYSTRLRLYTIDKSLEMFLRKQQ